MGIGSRGLHEEPHVGGGEHWNQGDPEGQKFPGRVSGPQTFDSWPQRLHVGRRDDGLGTAGKEGSWQLHSEPRFRPSRGSVRSWGNPWTPLSKENASMHTHAIWGWGQGKGLLEAF